MAPCRCWWWFRRGHQGAGVAGEVVLAGPAVKVKSLRWRARQWMQPASSQCICASGAPGLRAWVTWLSKIVTDPSARSVPVASSTRISEPRARGAWSKVKSICAEQTRQRSHWQDQFPEEWHGLPLPRLEASETLPWRRSGGHPSPIFVGGCGLASSRAVSYREWAGGDREADAVASETEGIADGGGCCVSA